MPAWALVMHQSSYNCTELEYLDKYASAKKKKKKKKMDRAFSSSITKTCLYNFDPLKPHFYIVKLGFTGVYVIFLISAQNIDCGYSLELPRRGSSNEYP